MLDLLPYAVVLAIGIIIGFVIKSPRLTELERKVKALEVRAGLRKAE